MQSPDIKDLIQSVDSVLCVPDKAQLSFAKQLLKAVNLDETVMDIKLLSDKLEFKRIVGGFGSEDPGTIGFFDVDVVFEKNRLEVKWVCF